MPVLPPWFLICLFSDFNLFIIISAAASVSRICTKCLLSGPKGQTFKRQQVQTPGEILKMPLPETLTVAGTWQKTGELTSVGTHGNYLAPNHPLEEHRQPTLEKQFSREVLILGASRICHFPPPLLCLGYLRTGRRVWMLRCNQTVINLSIQIHFKNSTLAHNELLWGEDLRYCCYTQLAFRAKTSWCFDFQALWSPFLVGFFLKICHNCNSQAHKTDTCVCTYTCFCTQMWSQRAKVWRSWTEGTSNVDNEHICT